MIPTNYFITINTIITEDLYQCIAISLLIVSGVNHKPSHN